MFENLNWAIVYNGRIRALFVTKWQAESFIETLHNKEEWLVKFVKGVQIDMGVLQ